MHGFSPFLVFESEEKKMATKKTLDTTISTEVAEKLPEMPTAKVTVFIPVADDTDSGAKVDQNEYVTINGKTTKVPRGEHVEVSVPVFIQLRNRYPNL